MRGTFGIRIQNPNISNAARKTLAPFSTSSGFGGGGRGRGGSPSGTGPFNFNERAPGKPDSRESQSDKTQSPIPPGSSGRGHGHGKPMSPPSGLPSFSSFLASINQSPAGRGRGTGAVTSQPEQDSPPPDSGPKKPIFFKREDSVSPTASDDFARPEKPFFSIRGDVNSPTARSGDYENDNKLPGSIMSVLSGLGRGKPAKPSEVKPQVTEENRHRRARQAPGAAASETVPGRRGFRERGEDDGSDSGRGRGFRERGGLVRGRGWGRGRGRGRGRGAGREGFRERDVDERRDRFMDAEDSDYGGLDVGDDEDGERLAQKLGPKMMNQLTEGFEEMASRVLPSPLDDEFLNAMDINYAIELEPEYLVEFDNPDIDEKEPIPLRDALEKMKPFLMAYEGIQSQEEWEEIMEETMMERVPLLKQIVDHYSGPDRVTAKKQQEELERVAKTLPKSAPSPVKEFTNRAVVSLQSNPGWGFDKKCHFMDKLVWEVSQHYK